MSILITGGTGFVGLNIAQYLSNLKITPVLMSALPFSKEIRQALHNQGVNFEYFQGSVTNQEDLNRVCLTYSITKIVHCAAITANQEREIQDTKEILSVNLLGSVEVFECALRHNIQQVIHFSSGSIFGDIGLNDPVIDELLTPVLPSSIYGISKLAAERVALRYRQTRHLNITTLRLGLVYGRWEYDTGHRDTLSLPFKIFCSAKKGEQVKIFKNIGKDYIYGSDVAKGIYKILEKGSSSEALYHLSSGFEWSLDLWLKNLKEKFPSFRYELTDDSQSCSYRLTNATLRSPYSIKRIQRDFNFSADFNTQSAFDDFISHHHLVNTLH